MKKSGLERGLREMEDKYTTEIDKLGTKRWYKNGELHRDDDLPAIEWNNGTKVWCRNGVKHRDGDLPAVEHTDGTKVWLKYGKRHRDGDNPAVIYEEGTKVWCKNDIAHREDGPALEYTNGDKYYYLEGIQYTQENYYKTLKEIDNLPIELKLTHEKEWVRERAKKNG